MRDPKKKRESSISRRTAIYIFEFASRSKSLPTTGATAVESEMVCAAQASRLHHDSPQSEGIVRPAAAALRVRCLVLSVRRHQVPPEPRPMLQPPESTAPRFPRRAKTPPRCTRDPWIPYCFTCPLRRILLIRRALGTIWTEEADHRW